METAQHTQFDSAAGVPLAVFVATSAEARAVHRALAGTLIPSRRTAQVMRVELNGRPLLVARTGIGQTHAATAARQLLDAVPIAAALSVGVAAGLSLQLQSGDLIVSDRVIVRREGAPSPECFPADPFLQEWALRRLRRSGHRHEHGAIVTVERLIATENEKRALASQTGAIAADMESGAIAGAATARGVPFLAIRAVLDPVYEDLTVAFERFLDPRGEPRWPLVCRYLLRHPVSFPALIDLGLRTRAACTRLGRLLRGLTDIQGRGQRS
jgi:adenosylhomocysteine nucleosidase